MNGAGVGIGWKKALGRYTIQRNPKGLPEALRHCTGPNNRSGRPRAGVRASEG